MRKWLWLLVLGGVVAFGIASVCQGGLLDFLGWGKRSRSAAATSSKGRWSPGPNAAGYTATRAQKATYHAAGATQNGYDAGRAHRNGYQGQRATRTGYGARASGH